MKLQTSLFTHSIKNYLPEDSAQSTTKLMYTL